MTICIVLYFFLQFLHFQYTNV